MHRRDCFGVQPPPTRFFTMTDLDRSRRSGVALEKIYQVLLWLIPAVEKFPRA